MRVWGFRAALTAMLISGAACSGEAAIAEADERAAEAVILARTGQVEAALVHFEEALALDPENLRALYNAGLAALELGKPDTAEPYVRAFLRLKPDDAPGHVLLARLETARGEREAAYATIRKAVELGLDDPSTLDDPGLAPLHSDLRFVQAKVLVAQRSGTRAVDSMGRLLVGETVLEKLRLPGSADEGAACDPGEFAAAEGAQP